MDDPEITPQQWETVRDVFERLARVMRNVCAAHVLSNGKPQDRVLALIFLRTKNKRIKRKQWKAIEHSLRASLKGGETECASSAKSG